MTYSVYPPSHTQPCTYSQTYWIKKIGYSKVPSFPCEYAAAMFTDPGLETSAGFNYTGTSQGHLSLYITLVDMQVMRPVLWKTVLRKGMQVIVTAQTTLKCLVILWRLDFSPVPFTLNSKLYRECGHELNQLFIDDTTGLEYTN